MFNRLQFALLLTLVLPFSGCGHLRGNFQVVDEGALYRSGQLKSSGLERRIEAHDIQTVISLRNPKPDERWYIQETELCDRLGVKHVDIPWSKEKLPAPEALERFYSALSTSTGPVLIHCQGGVHRSAIGSALYLIGQGESVETARGQLGFFFWHAPIGGLLDLYEQHPADDLGEWLVADYPGLYTHAPESLR